MDSKRTRRFLIVAFALSLLIHLVLSGVIRWPFRPSSDDVQLVSIEHLHATRIAHATPPPKRTPAPVAHKAPVHVAKAKAFNPHSRLTEGKAAFASETPPPSPSPVPTPGCAAGDTPVQLIASSPPPVPSIPPDARADAIDGVVRVRVIVNPDGSVDSASVLQSSGNPSFDLAAVDMARAAQYAPATHACKAIASAYVYGVRFSPY
ncbi:MAG TPA: TonB family protein [Candidatus Acidoferrales bacterium]|nr:TonB family protein [Candidatus Acidoferrales bacterium]